MSDALTDITENRLDAAPGDKHDRFDTAGDIDKVYHAALRHAFRAGVEVLCYACDIDPAGATLRRRVPWLGANGSE